MLMDSFAQSDDKNETLGSENESDSEKVVRRKKLLERSNHSMCTVQVSYPAEEEKYKKQGYNLVSFKSYIFGGLEMESDGRLMTSNELIEVSSRQLVPDSSRIAAMLANQSSGVAHYSSVKIKGGRKPVPRRDHCALMISSNRYMLIYGGKNDQAFSICKDSQGSDIMEKTCLNDICLFDFETFEWTSVAQFGFLPVGRWNSAIAFSEENQQLFIFGGSSHKGGCKNDIYVCDFNHSRVRSLESEYKRAAEEVKSICQSEFALKAKIMKQ